MHCEIEKYELHEKFKKRNNYIHKIYETMYEKIVYISQTEKKNTRKILNKYKFFI